MEQEDIPNAVSAQENKRKRKSGFNETETGSPGPSGRGLEARIGSPFRDAKARLTHTQYEAPLFSLDRLFTEKELTLVMNQAHMAATHFFTKPRTLDRRGNGGGSGGSASAAAASAAAAAAIATASTTASTTVADVVMGDATEPEEPLFDTGLPAIGKPDLIDDDSSLAAAVDMDRTASASQMTTRGASRNNANAAAVAAAAAAAAVAAADAVRSAEQSLPFPSTSTVQPIILPANMSSRSNAAAPAPPALVTADVDYDLILMGRSATVNAAINAKLLDRACGPLIARQYEFRPPTMQLDSGGGAATATASLSAVAAAAAATNAYSNPLIVTPQASAVGIGGVPMSAQSSTGGISDAGGVAMSRHGNGSSIGAIGMKRSASARGRS